MCKIQHIDKKQLGDSQVLIGNDNHEWLSLGHSFNGTLTVEKLDVQHLNNMF